MRLFGRDQACADKWGGMTQIPGKRTIHGQTLVMAGDDPCADNIGVGFDLSDHFAGHR